MRKSGNPLARISGCARIPEVGRFAAAAWLTFDE
jgi:hypothetical protein